MHIAVTLRRLDQILAQAASTAVSDDRPSRIELLPYER